MKIRKVRTVTGDCEFCRVKHDVVFSFGNKYRQVRACLTCLHKLYETIPKAWRSKYAQKK